MYNTKFSISYLMVPNRHQKNSQYEGLHSVYTKYLSIEVP